MLNRIKKLFAGPQADAPALPEDGRLAAAALLVRAARMDAQYDAAEITAISDCLKRHFELSVEELATLLADAEAAETDATDLFRWTRKFADNNDHTARVELIEMLWEVVYADGILSDYEANLLRRVAGLIYVPDREAGEARLRVLKRLGIEG